MFDVWYGDLNIGTALVAGAIVLILPLQLLLCFKVRRLWVRLLPVGIFCSGSDFCLPGSRCCGLGRTGVCHFCCLCRDAGPCQRSGLGSVVAGEAHQKKRKSLSRLFGYSLA